MAHVTTASGWTRADGSWIAVFATLTLATSLSALLGTLVDDTWRDIYFAHRIAYAEEFPLRGPVIGNIAQLGPVWFYLLAPVYGLAGVAGVMALLGALSGLKYPLAFLLGRRLGGTTLGAAFGLAWMIPTWNAIETGWPTHISAVASALLALALAALAFRRRPHWGRAVLLGLLAGLALHAHPTTALLGALLVAFALAGLPTWRARSAMALVAALPLALLFLPVLIAASMSRDAAPDNLIGLASHAAQLPLASIVERVGPVLRGLFWGAAELQWWVLLGLPERALALAFAATGVAWGLVLAGAVSATPASRRAIAWLSVALLVQTVFVLALRPITPFWMSFAHGPLLIAVVGVAGASLWRRGGAWRPALVTTTLAMAAGLGLLLWRMAAPAPTTYAPVFAANGPGFLSITERVIDRRRVRPIRMAPTAWERLGASLCTPTTIHGHLASLVDVSFAIGARRACGRIDQIALGGPTPPGHRARIGLSADASDALGLPRPTWTEGLRLFDVTQLHAASESMPIVAAGRYPRRDLSHFTPRRFTIEVRSRGSDVVALAWRGAFHLPIAIHAVDAGGHRVAAAYEDAALWLYRCAECAPDREVDWRIELDAVPSLIDVVAFDPAATAD